jgi:hypothetical protein
VSNLGHLLRQAAQKNNSSTKPKPISSILDMPTQGRPYTESRYISQQIKERKFHGEWHANFLVDWFNGHLREGTGKERVRKILSGFQRLGEIAQDKSVGEREWTKRVPTHPLVKEANLLMGSLHQAVARYRLEPDWVIHLSGPGPEVPLWPPTMFLSARIFLRSGRQAEESHVIEKLFKCIEDGVLHKILTCSCGKLFFQRFSHQRFCSEKCRSKSYQDSETWREYRRNKAREYYHLQISGKVK